LSIYRIRIHKTSYIKKTIPFIRAIIGRHGYPKSLTTDNGPQFRAEEFIQFCKEMDIKLNLTTPYWPQANGEDKIVV
jgi:transposase InsO family protein